MVRGGSGTRDMVATTTLTRRKSCHSRYVIPSGARNLDRDELDRRLRESPGSRFLVAPLLGMT